MKQLWKVLAACAFTLPLVVAAQEPAPGAEHEQHAAPSPGAEAEAEAGGHSMAAMHEHMRAMREQMARIHAAENPAERQRLMQEHMQSMQRHMDMLGAMRGSELNAGGRPCAAGEAPALNR